MFIIYLKRVSFCLYLYVLAPVDPIKTSYYKLDLYALKTFPQKLSEFGSIQLSW